MNDLMNNTTCLVAALIESGQLKARGSHPTAQELADAVAEVFDALAKRLADCPALQRQSTPA